MANKTKNDIVLDLLAAGKGSPETINAAVGGKYAAKYISTLRKLGYEIKSVKDGRTVTSYVLTVSLSAAAPAVTAEEVEDEEVVETSSPSVVDEDVSPLAASAEEEDDVAISDEWDQFDGDVRTLVS